MNASSHAAHTVVVGMVALAGCVRAPATAPSTSPAGQVAPPTIPAPAATANAFAPVPASKAAAASNACEELAPRTIRLIDMAPQNAARFIARITGTSIIAVGSPLSGARCEERCRSLDVGWNAEDALKTIGFETRRIGSIVIASSLAAPGAAPGRGGPDVEFDLERASSPMVFRLLGDTSQLDVHDAPTGLVTVVSRSEGSRALLAALSSAAGAKLDIEGRRARVTGGPPALPEVSVSSSGDACPPTIGRIFFSCVDPALLRVVALARTDRGPVALVTAPNDDHGTFVFMNDVVGVPRTVKTGDQVTTRNRQVVAIGCGGLRLDDDLLVPLSDGKSPAD